MKKSLDAHIKYITAHINELEKEIAAHVQAHPEWGPRDQLLQSIPAWRWDGHTLLGHLPELAP